MDNLPAAVITQKINRLRAIMQDVAKEGHTSTRTAEALSIAFVLFEDALQNLRTIADAAKAPLTVDTRGSYQP